VFLAPRGSEPIGKGQQPVHALLYDAGAGEANSLVISQTPSGLRVSDGGAAITPGPGCLSNGSDVVCSAAGRLYVERVELGDQNDSADVPGDFSALVRGGPGADSLFGRGDQHTRITFDGGLGPDTFGTDGAAGRVVYGPRASGVTATLDGVANDGEAGEGDNLRSGVSGVNGTPLADVLDAQATPAFLDGEGGDDVLIGSPQVDRLYGGEGDDLLQGGDGDDWFRNENGADRYRGGPGAHDRFDYSGDQPVTITLDDQPGDGIAGERDDIGSDVEDVLTGDGDDRVVGSDAANFIAAGEGADHIDGSAGDDVLIAGGDVLAEPRPNTAIGGRGHDEFRVSGGVESIEAADGEVDTIDCQNVGVLAGLRADPFDSAVQCTPSAAMVRPRPGVGVARVDRRGRAVILVSCPRRSDIACTGVVRIRRGSKTAARGSFTIAAGVTTRVSLRLARETVRLVRRGRRVRGWVDITTSRPLPAVAHTRRGGVLTLRRR
jgi:Ca2+-binding RTX toxin-like protein